MNNLEKEKKIKSTIEEITGFTIQSEYNLDDKKKSKNPSILILKDDTGKEIAKVCKINDFVDVLLSIDEKIILKYSKKRGFSKWLKEIGEDILSDKYLLIEQQSDNGEDLRKKMIDSIEKYKYSLEQSYIKNHKRDEQGNHIQLSHIGLGSFGGKARGIAFLANILAKYIKEDMFPGLRITIPRSIVLSTDVFDSFIRHNDLLKLDFNNLSDERIASKFMDSTIPATVIGDLRSFIKNTRKPLIVRSSSLLEDSLLEPFAGIYASMLLPNESWETELRFK
ncbi:MAG: hypothetical protein FK731_02700, partial [Asgard group archaeon]|nr:hypothetical protein [Asgard group archaeon]